MIRFILNFLTVRNEENHLSVTFIQRYKFCPAHTHLELASEISLAGTLWICGKCRKSHTIFTVTVEDALLKCVSVKVLVQGGGEWGDVGLEMLN